jgi:hypothetical protein
MRGKRFGELGVACSNLLPFYLSFFFFWRPGFDLILGTCCFHQDACVVVDGAVSYGVLDTFSRIRVVIDQRRETHCL